MNVIRAVATIFILIVFSLAVQGVRQEASASSGSDQWLRYHGDSTNQGYSSTAGLMPDSNSSCTASQNLIGNIDGCSPAVSDGIVYICSEQRDSDPETILWAMNASTLEPIWNRTLTGEYRGYATSFGSPVVSNGMVFVSTDLGSQGGYLAYLYGLNASTGEPASWSPLNMSGISPAPVVDASGTLYIGSHNRVCAVNPSTGNVLWNVSTGLPVHCLGLAFASNIIVGSFPVDYGYDGTLFAFNKTDGSIIWNYTTPYARPIAAASPVIYGGRVYLATDYTEIYVLDLYNGTLYGNYSVPVAAVKTPAVAYGMLYASSGEGCMYPTLQGNVVAINITALNSLDSSLYRVWNYKIGSNSSCSSPCIADGKLFIGSCDTDNHSILALSAYTGRLLWTYQTDGPVHSSAALVDGNVYMADNKRVYCIAHTQVHDVAITRFDGYARGKRAVCENCTIRYEVFLENQGSFEESITVQLCANDTLVASNYETMGTGATDRFRTINVRWNTTGYSKGTYVIIVNATVIDDKNPSDNVMAYGFTNLTRQGDITGPNGFPDGKVDMRDVGTVSQASGSTRYNSPWYYSKYGMYYHNASNPQDQPHTPCADILGLTLWEEDGKIDLADVAFVAKNWSP